MGIYYLRGHSKNWWVEPTGKQILTEHKGSSLKAGISRSSVPPGEAGDGVMPILALMGTWGILISLPPLSTYEDVDL